MLGHRIAEQVLDWKAEADQIVGKEKPEVIVQIQVFNQNHPQFRLNPEPEFDTKTMLWKAVLDGAI